jgi:hypothetical protein
VRLLHDAGQVAEDDEELEAPALDVPGPDEDVEPDGAGEAAAAGAAAGAVPALSVEAGVFVLSVSDAAGLSADSLPVPGFILSE